MKSFIAIKIIEKLSVKTVILVDEIFLAAQWSSYLLKNTQIKEEEILVLTSKTGKKELKKIDTANIIIASKDSVYGKRQMIESLKNQCGLLVIDEQHVAAAKIFREVIGHFDAKWILGLTASATRDDGMSPLVFSMTGDPVYKADIFDSVKLGSSILPILRPIYLRKSQPHDIDVDKDHYATISSTAMRDEGALIILASIIKSHYDNNDYQLVITQRVEESEIIKQKLMTYGIKEEEIGLVLGIVDLKKREEIVAKVETGEVKVIISSTVFDQHKVA